MYRDYDTKEQVDMFYEYLVESAEIEDRVKYNNAYSHNESEWESFQYGWNAAKKHFGVEE